MEGGSTPRKAEADKWQSKYASLCDQIRQARSKAKSDAASWDKITYREAIYAGYGDVCNGRLTEDLRQKITQQLNDAALTNVKLEA
jgi:hypothetical protein